MAKTRNDRESAAFLMPAHSAVQSRAVRCGTAGRGLWCGKKKRREATLPSAACTMRHGLLIGHGCVRTGMHVCSRVRARTCKQNNADAEDHTHTSDTHATRMHMALMQEEKNSVPRLTLPHRHARTHACAYAVNALREPSCTQSRFEPEIERPATLVAAPCRTAITTDQPYRSRRDGTSMCS